MKALALIRSLPEHIKQKLLDTSRRMERENTRRALGLTHTEVRLLGRMLGSPGVLVYANTAETEQALASLAEMGLVIHRATSYRPAVKTSERGYRLTEHGRQIALQFHTPPDER